MRILGITGSPRGARSSTRKLMESVLAGAKAAVELVDVSEMNLAYCTACEACHITGECPKQDDIEPLRTRMFAADGLVLGSPVYFGSVTAQLKTVMDRLSNIIHCQSFIGKYGCSVCSSGSAEEHGATIAYMNDVLLRLGCNIVGGVGAAASVPGAIDSAMPRAEALGRDLVQAIKEKRSYPDQDATHALLQERFTRLVSLNKDHWPSEYRCWKSKGLL